MSKLTSFYQQKKSSKTDQVHHEGKHKTKKSTPKKPVQIIQNEETHVDEE